MRSLPDRSARRWWYANLDQHPDPNGFGNGNPNEYSDAPEAARRNRAVQDLYEPGSTFKLVTASAAIEQKVVTPDEMIDVTAGMIRFGSRVIDDMHRNPEIWTQEGGAWKLRYPLR